MNKHQASSEQDPRFRLKGLSLSLRSKFLMGTALMLLGLCIISAFFIYYREKSLLEESAFRKTEMVMAAVEASRMYIREELRPRMIEKFGQDFFMLEAMSTSYVGRAVMGKLQENLPEYSYRRVAVNARNPDFEASAREKSMIRYFHQNRDKKSWQGLMNGEGLAEYMRFKPVYFEQSCMSCHGNPDDAPAQLIQQYGAKRGFGHHPGELAGLIAVGIPVQSALAAIKEKASSAFLAVFFGASVFYLLLTFFFNWIVVSNLRGVLSLFRDELDEKNLPAVLDKSVTGDELETISQAAHNLASHLRETREELRRHAQQLEKKVAHRTRALKKSEMLLRQRVLDRNQELKVLNSIAELTTRAGGIHDIWPRAMEQILSLLPAQGLGVYLMEDNQHSLSLVYADQARELPGQIDCGDVRESVEIEPDMTRSRLRRSLCMALQGRMDSFAWDDAGLCLNIPFSCRGKILGIMTFVRVRAQEISEEQKELLLSMGRQIGIAVESLNGLQKLIQNKELLQSVFDGITDMVMLLDRDYRIKMVNRAYLETYQVTLEDVLDTHCYESHSGYKKPCPDCDLDRVLSSGRPFSTENSCVSGRIHLVHFYPILNEDGEVERIIRYVRDITEQKKVKEKIQQTERLVSMGQLAAGVAHEINNPLGIILCYAELLKRQLADFPQGLKDLHVIEKQTKNCKRIVTDLLQFSRGQGSSKGMGRINTTISDVMQIFTHQFKKQKIRLEQDLDPRIPEMKYDENRIKQVLVNLTMNACQAMEKSGELYVSSFFSEESEAVKVVFRDTGRGMPPEVLNRIFDPFFSTKKAGESTGLGLSVSYGIIRDHGGEI
ncbi:MAG: c-type heme family protein, partial [Desulfonatronovibrionaceae bacterium]